METTVLNSFSSQRIAHSTALTYTTTWRTSNGQLAVDQFGVFPYYGIIEKP